MPSFSVLCCGIRMHIPILTGVQNGHTILRKKSHILLNFLVEALFPRWRSLVPQHFLWYFDYLFKMPSFSVLYSWHMYENSHPNRDSKWMHKSLNEQSNFAKKRSSQGFISEMKVTCIPTFCLIFCLFILNTTFFSSLVVAYVCNFPS